MLNIFCSFFYHCFHAYWNLKQIKRKKNKKLSFHTQIKCSQIKCKSMFLAKRSHKMTNMSYEFDDCFNPISHRICFVWLPWVGGGVHPPQFFVYTVTYTFIDSLNPRGENFSFKTLNMRATQISAANLTNTLKIQKSNT
jgi:hypothetical protein